MSYDIAIQKAWVDYAKLSPDKIFKVKFLADEYTVDLENKRVISLSGNVVAKDFVAILILHYLIQKLKGLSVLTGVWLTFKELSGIEGYYSAFRKRSIEPIVRKYGTNPQGILSILDRLQRHDSKKAPEFIRGPACLPAGMNCACFIPP